MIDYRELLKKYMRLVKASVDIDCLPDECDSREGLGISESDMQDLIDIQQELQHE